MSTSPSQYIHTGYTIELTARVILGQNTLADKLFAQSCPQYIAREQDVQTIAQTQQEFKLTRSVTEQGFITVDLILPGLSFADTLFSQATSQSRSRAAHRGTNKLLMVSTANAFAIGKADTNKGLLRDNIIL